MAEDRRTGKLDELMEYNEAKLKRVLRRVQAVKQGEYDGYCGTGFCNEVRFLKVNGIQLN